MKFHCGGHQDRLSELNGSIVVGEINETEKYLHKIIEGGSELSDEENDGDEY